jgi:hypothetical protein
MGQLDPVAVSTLGSLVSATVFATTFLTTRVHRERGRAIDRALKIDEAVSEAARKRQPVDADWFDEQGEVLDETLNDRLRSSPWHSTACWWRAWSRSRRATAAVPVRSGGNRRDGA